VKLNQLEIFCKIIEVGSFSRAAEALHLSQPTLTEHVKSLENYLGSALLDRLGREIIPTRAGELLFTYAKKILNLKVEAEQKIHGLKGVLKGNLFLGASTIPGEYVLPPLIKVFRDKFPDIFIRLDISDTRMVTEDILNNRIELGIVGEKLERTKIEYYKFVKDELILVVSPASSWAEKKSISLENLQEIPFVLREDGSGTRMVMKKTLKDRGFDISHLKVVSMLGSTTAVIQAVKSNVGCSILSRRAVLEELEKGILKYIPIEKIKILRNFYMIFRRGKTKSPLGETFFNFLLDKSKDDKLPS